MVNRIMHPYEVGENNIIPFFYLWWERHKWSKMHIQNECLIFTHNQRKQLFSNDFWNALIVPNPLTLHYMLHKQLAKKGILRLLDLHFKLLESLRNTNTTWKGWERRNNTSPTIYTYWNLARRSWCRNNIRGNYPYEV
jgi:hypothetical protein